MNRAKLREQIRLMRREQPRKLVESKSKQIQARLLSLREFLEAETVSFYAAKRADGEVETEDMIKSSLKKKKRVLVPITDKENRRLIFSELRDYDLELVPGTFEIPEPKSEYRRIVSPSHTDLVVVPGIVFDMRGYRLGYGFGYYDRFLSSLRKETPTIGLAFEFQIVGKIPVGDQDIPVRKIVTEQRVICCRQ